MRHLDGSRGSRRLRRARHRGGTRGRRPRLRRGEPRARSRRSIERSPGSRSSGRCTRPAAAAGTLAALGRPRAAARAIVGCGRHLAAVSGGQEGGRPSSALRRRSSRHESDGRPAEGHVVAEQSPGRDHGVHRRRRARGRAPGASLSPGSPASMLAVARLEGVSRRALPERRGQRSPDRPGGRGGVPRRRGPALSAAAARSGVDGPAATLGRGAAFPRADRVARPRPLPLRGLVRHLSPRAVHRDRVHDRRVAARAHRTAVGRRRRRRARGRLLVADRGDRGRPAVLRDRALLRVRLVRRHAEDLGRRHLVARRHRRRGHRERAAGAPRWATASSRSPTPWRPRWRSASPSDASAT